jgi:hypothetical protein
MSNVPVIDISQSRPKISSKEKSPRQCDKCKNIQYVESYSSSPAIVKKLAYICQKCKDSISKDRSKTL